MYSIIEQEDRKIIKEDRTMFRKILCSNGLEASTIGLGCMGMSEFYGDTDDKESKAILKRAVQLGINHFDTADIYGFGHNEQLVGEALKPYRSQVIIATKFGIVRDKKDPTARGLNGRPEYVKISCENSLKRLGIDTIDLYYMHRMDPQVPIEDTVGAMGELVKEGKVHHIGLSEVSANSIRRAYAIHPITAIQTEYSLWSRGPEKEVIPLCEDLGIAFVSYSPLGRGFLTGKMKNLAQQTSSNDFRFHLPRLNGENLEHNLKIVKAIEEVAKSKECSPAQIALSWVLTQNPYVTAIPGTKKRSYLEENVAGAKISLTEKEVSQLNAMIPPGFAKGERYPSASMKAYQLDE